MSQSNGHGAWEKLYGGEVLLSFDARQHLYRVREAGLAERVAPSVTTILGVIDKSGPLMQWAVNCAINSLGEELQPGQSYDEIELAEMLENARKNYRRVSKRARDIGTHAHGWLEKFVALKLSRKKPPEPPVNPLVRNCCQAALKWIRQHKFRPLEAERRLYSRRYRFAGTPDVLGFARVDGRTAVIDWKSSKALYPEYRIQLAAYQEAYSEMTGQKVEDRWLVRLGKEDGEFEAVRLEPREQPRDFAAFLAAKKLWERLEELKR